MSDSSIEINSELDHPDKSVQSGLIQKLTGAVDMTSYQGIFLQPR